MKINKILVVVIVILVIILGFFIKSNDKEKINDSVVENTLIDTTASEVIVEKTNQEKNTSNSNNTQKKVEAKAFFVAPNYIGSDKKLDDCKNAIVGVTYEVGGVTPLRDSINILLSTSYIVGETGLTNPVGKYGYKIDELSLVEGVATLKLSGKTMETGYCNKLAIFGQLKKTMMQFPTVYKSQIFINGIDILNLVDH